MRERRQILDLFRQGQAVALATIVRVEGSSYRSAGARLLLAANGKYAGTVSGGCLESEIARKAAWLVRSGAVVERYSTFFDDTAEIPYGLGCGGALEVLLEPTNTPAFAALMQAMESSLLGESMCVRTKLPTANTPLRREIVSAAGEVLFSDFDAEEDSAPVFEEVLDPPQRLIVCGAGDDVQPLVLFAAQLGWSVIVADGRSQWARAERFPEAESVVASMSLDSVLIHERDAVVVMTHSYEQDRSWLATVLPHAPFYVGLLGARHRSALLLSEIAQQLELPLERMCESVFAPVGLDLGGEGAEAIALAIVAEIQAHRTGRLPASRRLTPQMVEQQRLIGDSSRYVETECAL